ncbi:MAG: hypothetical protein M1835_004119, partial [Candelina submexicana]
IIKADTATSHTLIRADNPKCDSLPGQPRTRLHSHSLFQDLKKEFLTPDLDKLAPYLWLIATQFSQHITPLHEQVLKGRQIVITENPELHLVWTDGRIFIKPIPRYMLSHTFWTTHLTTPRPHSNCASPETQHDQPPTALLRAALGYMRTYHHLIQHESDLHLATENHLLPPRFNNSADNVITPRNLPRIHFEEFSRIQRMRKSLLAIPHPALYVSLA